MGFKYQPMKLPDTLERFIESNDAMKVKSSAWLENEISKC